MITLLILLRILKRQQRRLKLFEEDQELLAVFLPHFRGNALFQIAYLAIRLFQCRTSIIDRASTSDM